MPAIDKQAIKTLTTLSRISCSEEEQEALLVDLQKILNYIDQLNEIDTAETPVCNQVLPDMANVMREDKVGDVMPRALFLENAPSQIGGMIRVPPVIKQGG